MAGEMRLLVEEMRHSRVAVVSEDGQVVLRFPDGTERTLSIPREAVKLVRRLAAIDRELDEKARRVRRG